MLWNLFIQKMQKLLVKLSVFLGKSIKIYTPTGAFVGGDLVIRYKL